MTHALVAAMAGAGIARGRHTVDRRLLFGILRRWLIGPAGFILPLIGETLAR